MRGALLTTLVIGSLLGSPSAHAVSLTNLDQERLEVFVCDDKCGPNHGDDWGSAREFWLSPGETRTFDCSGQCFVGLYNGDKSPTLGDMAMADDDELFQGDEAGYIQRGIVTHKRN
jgi:hypothetical protein